jgi:LysM repeat protein
MKRKFCAGICVLTASLLTPGCFNSEEEYRTLTEEVSALSAEMEAAKGEKEILAEALKNIEGEKARLKTALAPYEPAPAAGDGAASTLDAAGAAGAPAEGTAATAPTAPPTASGRVHVAQRGDFLASLATRYNTDVQTLINLNPYLRQRTDYMVWENDHIQLPGLGTAAPAPVPAAPPASF